MYWLISHAHGNPNVRSVLKTLTLREGNVRFETVLAVPRFRMFRILAKKIDFFDRVLLKTYPEIPFKIIKISILQFFSFGTKKSFESRTDSNGRSRDQNRDQELKLDSRVARKISSNLKIDAIYGYQGACIKQFEKAKETGALKVLELPNSLRRTIDIIAEEESKKFPEWDFGFELVNDRERIYSQELEEIELADWIVVPSEQVKESISNICNPEKIVLIPYAISLNMPKRESLSNARPNRILIVSRLISTKGIHYLEQAVRNLKVDYELFIVGALPSFPSNALLNFLNRHNYLGNISRNKVVELMRTCEIFILPSLIEGRSLSSLEALSQGLIPVLTPGTGASDIVEENGILIPSRSSSAIQEALQILLNMKPSKKIEMRNHSLEIAQSLSEKSYIKSLDRFFSSIEKSR